MNNLTKITTACLLLITTLSFKYIAEQFEFSYPKRDNTTVTINVDGFKDFKKEWRGDDYYYMGTSKDGIICSILYFKLNKGEQAQMVDPTGPSAMIPYIYFSENSNLKAYEKNNEKWGETTDDFMFRQNNITDFNGIKMRQKNMYAYGMFDKDIFINVHLSKIEYSTADSTTMRAILASLTKKKK